MKRTSRKNAGALPSPQSFSSNSLSKPSSLTYQPSAGWPGLVAAAT